MKSAPSDSASSAGFASRGWLPAMPIRAPVARSAAKAGRTSG